MKWRDGCVILKVRLPSMATRLTNITRGIHDLSRKKYSG
ncbi:hypothetical protein AO378_0809 [Moraxella catarrhalis]|nr:hypothetical protein AO378_0809 [Moraxella catarrhalis]